MQFPDSVIIEIPEEDEEECYNTEVLKTPFSQLYM